MDRLAARLHERTQLEHLTLGRGRPDLLEELSPGHGQQVGLTRFHLTFGDRPAAIVPLRPERAAHVSDEHEQLVAADAVAQQGGTDAGGQVRSPGGPGPEPDRWSAGPAGPA